MSLAASKFEPNVPGSSQQVAVVLCCTAGDVQVVTALAQELRSENAAEPQVVLLEGESFDELKALAAEQAGNTVLYVLCRGSDMSVAAIQQVRSVLRGHAGGQFMTVQVSSVDRMQAALSAALSGPRFSQGADKEPPATIRGVPAANSRPPRRGAALPGPRGMMTNPPAPPRAAAPSRAPRTLLGAANPPEGNFGGPAAPRTLMGAAPSPEGPVPHLDPGPSTMMGAAPPPEGPVAPNFADQGPRTLMGAAPPAQGIPGLDAGPSTMMGAVPPPEGIPLQEAAPGTMMGVAVPPEGPAFAHEDLEEPIPEGAWPQDAEEASISGSATVTFGVSPHQPAANSNLDADPQGWQNWLGQGQQAWQELWSPERRALKLGVAGGLIVLIPALALLVWFGLSDSKEESAAQQDHALALDDLAEPTANKLHDLAPEEPVIPAAQPQAQAEPAKAPAPKQVLPNEGKPEAKPSPKRAAAPSGGEPDAIKYTEFLRVEAALRQSSIRGLDSLIIDTSKSRKFTFRSARRHCNRKEAGKLSGWRLPSGRELSRVAAANMVGRGSYWAQPSSRSKSRRAFVWDSKRKKLVKKSAKFRGARALCVRDRVSTAAGR